MESVYSSTPLIHLLSPLSSPILQREYCPPVVLSPGAPALWPSTCARVGAWEMCRTGGRAQSVGSYRVVVSLVLCVVVRGPCLTLNSFFNSFLSHRYFQFEGAAGSDAQAGRTAAGLPIAEPEFAHLPPHFAPESTPSKEEIMHIFPHYQHYPANFLPVLPYLFASLIHVSHVLLSFISSYSAFISCRKLSSDSRRWLTFIFFKCSTAITSCRLTPKAILCFYPPSSSNPLCTTSTRCSS